MSIVFNVNFPILSPYLLLSISIYTTSPSIVSYSSFIRTPIDLQNA